MTLSTVEERLDALLSGNEPKIIMLTGGWGTGKTYQWKQAIHRATKADQPARYAYVSLFGLTSLGEVRKRLVEETTTEFKIPGKTETIGKTIADNGWRLKPMQIVKLLPVIPYLGKLEVLVNELSFSSVRNAVVCFDDLERGGTNLRLADVFGLALFLKDERQCKVIIVSNEDKLSPDRKKDLLLHLEKVVDETINLAPTPGEACNIALGLTPDSAGMLLGSRINQLGISNIRVITRLGNMAAELADLLIGCHERVLQKAIQALSLFGAAKFLSDDDNRFPSFDYLMELQNPWAHYLSGEKAGKKTEEDRKLVGWGALLEACEYSVTSRLDAEIGRSVKRGFFDKGAIVPLAKELSDTFEVDTLLWEFSAKWICFWQTLDGNGDQLLTELRDATIRAIAVISLDDLKNAYDVFSEVGQTDIATELLELFIATNQRLPAAFNQVDGEFSETFTGAFAARLRDEKNKRTPQPSVVEALDRIDPDRGWTLGDARIVSMADTGEIERILRQSKGLEFRTRLRALLSIGTIQNGLEHEEPVSQRTVEILKKLANEDPITAIRLRRYIPADRV